MGLPVGRIMEEVEHELRHMDDELSDEVDVNMEVEEEADDNMEVEEEVDDNMENELDGIILEVVDGIKEGSRWLIVDDVQLSTSATNNKSSRDMMYGDARISGHTGAHLRL